MEAEYQLLMDKLRAIEIEIKDATSRRTKILSRMAKLQKWAQMKKLGRYMVDEIVAKGKIIDNPDAALKYVNVNMLPWRHSLSKDYFENTLEVFSENFPSHFTRDQKDEFFAAMSAALEKDIEGIESAAKEGGVSDTADAAAAVEQE
jgi:hypothetical protein